MRGGAALNTFVDQIIAAGRKKRVKDWELSVISIRKEICDNELASKREMPIKMVESFPELAPFLSSDRKWKEEFFYNMFDTVALGAALSLGTKV